jgi:hypothetical protein
MKRQQGIAIVSGLIVLVVIMAIGVGALFLTNTNLRTSENVRSNAVAAANAESGLEIAALLLRESYLGTTTNRSFPSSLTLPATSTYSLASYNRTNSSQAVVKILGVSASGGEFLSEAVIKVQPGDPILPPVYSLGLASEGTVTVTSNASLYIDASVHGNNGIDLGGTFATCDERVKTKCIRYTTLSTAPVSISSRNATCKLKSGTYSNVCSNKTAITRAPISISPSYYTRRDRAADLNGDGTFTATNFSTSTDCASATVSTSLSTAVPNSKYCITGAVNLTANPLSLKNTTIIASGNITISGSATLENVTLISLTGLVSFGSNVNATGVRVFSQKDLSLQSNSLTWNGINTLATYGNITFNGSNNANNIVNPVYNADGSVAIGLALIAEGSITFNGRNNATDTYYATFIAGKELTQNGKSNFYGTISAKGNLTFHGNFFIDSGLDVTNTDLMEDGEPYLSTLARR